MGGSSIVEYSTMQYGTVTQDPAQRRKGSKTGEGGRLWAAVGRARQGQTGQDRTEQARALAVSLTLTLLSKTLCGSAWSRRLRWSR